MILVGIAWLYVVLLIALVQATGAHGRVLGALFTVGFYGMLPLSILGYLCFSPARRRVRRARERASGGLAGSDVGCPADGRDHPPGEAIAPVGEEP
jgi:hypothetical protein